MSTRTLDVCLPYSLGCDEVGKRVQIVLLPEYADLATCNNVIPSEVIFFEKIQGKVVTKKEKAWDTCKKAWVINNTYEYCYDYCYTLEWDSAATNPDGIEIKKEYVEHYACFTPSEQVIANSRLVQLSNGDIRYKNGFCDVDTVKIRSLQTGNLITTSTQDLGNYLSAQTVSDAVLANFSISVGGNTGPNKTVGAGQLLRIVGGPGITTNMTDPRTVAIYPRLSSEPGNLLQIIGNDLYAGSAGSGSTDSLQVTETNPAGTLQLKHTAVNGSQAVFTSGFKTVAQNDGCGPGNAGVGPNKMVRSIFVNAGELRVDAAPEHHSYGAGVAFTGAIIEDITTNAGGEKTHGPTPPLIIVNLSKCRQVNGLFHMALNLQLECYQGGVWRHNGFIDLGAGPQLVATAQYGIFPGLTGIPANMTFFGALSIAPSGTLTLRASQRLVVLAPSFPPSGQQSRIVAGSIGLAYVGGST